MDDDHVNRSAITGEFVSDDEAAKHPATTVRESRDDRLPRLAVAAREANDAMRLYNRGGMRWMELDGIFARLDAMLGEVEGDGDVPVGAAIGESIAHQVNAPLPELVGFDTGELAALEAHFTRYFAPFGVTPGKPGATPLRTARYKIAQALAIEKRDMERARRLADEQGGGTEVE